MALKVEIVVGGSVNAKEALSGSGRFETLHLALAPQYRLAAVFGPIVLSQSLLMVAGNPKMLEGSAVRAQLVSRHRLRRETLLAEQLGMSLTAAHLSRRR